MSLESIGIIKILMLEITCINKIIKCENQKEILDYKDPRGFQNRFHRHDLGFVEGGSPQEKSDWEEFMLFLLASLGALCFVVVSVVYLLGLDFYEIMHH